MTIKSLKQSKCLKRSKNVTLAQKLEELASKRKDAIDDFLKNGGDSIVKKFKGVRTLKILA